MATYKVITALVDELIDPILPKPDAPGPLQNLNIWLRQAIQLEPDTADPSERGPVTRWLGCAAGIWRITKTQALTLLPILPGDPNPFFPIIDSVSREGGKIIIGNGPYELSTAENVNRPMWKTPEYAVALVLTGGDAIDLPVWFEITDPTEICPFSTQNPITGEYETWETWGTFGESHKPQLIGGKWYRSNCVGASGAIMKASEWFPAYSQGLKIISESDFRSIQLANQPEL